MLGILQLFSTREIHQLISVGNIGKQNAREIMASHNDVQTPDSDGDIISVLGEFSLFIYSIRIRPWLHFREHADEPRLPWQQQHQLRMRLGELT